MESKEREYESMSTMEDREELLSSTEVEDSLMGDEEKGQWRSRSHSSPQEIRRKRDAVKSHRWIIGTILQLVIVAMLGLLLFRQQEVKETPPETPQVGGDFNGKGPTSMLHRIKRMRILFVLIVM